MKRLSRREFITVIGGAGAAFLAGCSEGNGTTAGSVKARASKFQPNALAVASGNDPAKNTRGAIDALGGIGKLVRKGDFVVIKPNIAWI